METVGVKSEGKFVGLDITTDGSGVNVGLGGSGQESRDGGTLLALKSGKAVFEDEFLVLDKTGLGGFLVVEGRSRGSVDGRVDENRVVRLVTSSGDASKAEGLCLFSDGRVSLAGRWSLL